ncbi:YadA family autotransporter adhesin, partial [Burkholderia gladioli]|uniref:YadA family autotransporter adhesin n=2 Tax=Burkholderia gladioli TaxID=28095 RepID=UPI003F79509F
STNAGNIASVSTGLASVSSGLSTVASRVALLSPVIGQSAAATGQGASVLGTTLGGGAGGLLQTQGGTWNGTATTLIDASTCQTAAGPDTTATGLCASAGSSASGGAAAGATAYGAYAQAQSANTTAVGFRAIASYAGSVALGYQARAIADPTVAVGANALASGNDAVALGAGATASAAGAVALGANSIATDPQTVSVGSAGNERRLVNVAPGIAPTDAVNVSQLNALRDSVSAVQRGAYAGIASAMAMPALVPSEAGRTIVGAGVGNYNGYTAVAAGVTYRAPDGHWLVHGAGSISGSGMTGWRAQAGYEF